MLEGVCGGELAPGYRAEERGKKVGRRTVQPDDAKKTTNPAGEEKRPHLADTEGKVRYPRVPHVCRAQHRGDCEANEEDLGGV